MSYQADAFQSPMPTVEFYRLIEQAPFPTRGDRSARGSLPLRATQYCESATIASSLGYYIYPPIRFGLILKGDTIHYSYDGLDGWYALDAIQYPYFSSKFDTSAPPALRGCAPPFLTKLPEPGHFQLWTGLIAKTAPNWSILVRPVVNMPPMNGCFTYEGIIETDRWFGPLFINFKITEAETPILFDLKLPLAQLQLIHYESYSNIMQNTMVKYRNISSISLPEWESYRENIVDPSSSSSHRPGAYAIATRRRRRSAESMAVDEAALNRALCPMHSDAPIDNQ